MKSPNTLPRPVLTSADRVELPERPKKRSSLEGGKQNSWRLGEGLVSNPGSTTYKLISDKLLNLLSFIFLIFLYLPHKPGENRSACLHQVLMLWDEIRWLISFSKMPDIWSVLSGYWGFPGGAVVKESTCQCRRHGFDSWIRNIPRRRK